MQIEARDEVPPPPPSPPSTLFTPLPRVWLYRTRFLLSLPRSTIFIIVVLYTLFQPPLHPPVLVVAAAVVIIVTIVTKIRIIISQVASVLDE